MLVRTKEQAKKGEFYDVRVGLYRGVQLLRAKSRLASRSDGRSNCDKDPARPWTELGCGSIGLSFLPREGGRWVIDLSADKRELPAKTIQNCCGGRKKTIRSHHETVQTCSCPDAPIHELWTLEPFRNPILGAWHYLHLFKPLTKRIWNLNSNLSIRHVDNSALRYCNTH